MNKVVAFLNQNPVQYLATVGRDGKTVCRKARRCCGNGRNRIPSRLRICKV